MSLSLVTAAQAAPRPVPAAPDLNVSSFILMDYDTGTILAEKDPDKKIEPASITKVMSAYLVDKALADGDISINDAVTISEKAWRMKGSKMFIEVNKQVSVDELINGMIIQSGNDATVALAEHIAGSEEAFVGYMNHQADVLGLQNTEFQNATGWPADNHYSSARDIALLSQAVIRDYPDHYALYSEKEYTFNKIRQFNRNRLLWQDKSVDGLKTGHTEAAGYCLVSSSKREDMRLIAVVMGAESDKQRSRDSQALLNYGFRFFETQRLYEAGEALQQAKVWFGTQEQLNLGLSEDLALTIPRGRYQDLKIDAQMDARIEAPISAGQVLGQVNIKLDEQILANRDLVALHDVADGGLVKKAMDSFKMLFE